MNRSTIPALPALHLLAAWFLCSLGPMFRGPLLALLVAAQLVAQARLSQVATREDWRGAASIIDARARPGDLVIFDAGYGRTAFEHYTQRRDLPHVGVEMGLRGAAEAWQNEPRAWLIRFHRRPEPEAVARAAGPCHRVAARLVVSQLELYLIERDLARCPAAGPARP